MKHFSGVCAGIGCFYPFGAAFPAGLTGCPLGFGGAAPPQTRERTPETARRVIPKRQNGGRT